MRAPCAHKPLSHMQHIHTPSRIAPLLAFLFVPGLVAAQNSYSFHQTTAPYVELIGGTPLDPDVNGADIFEELGGETFWFYDMPLTFGPMPRIYAFDIGYIIVEMSSSVVAIDAINQPLQAVDANTATTYGITGSPGNKVLTVQWKNWHISGAPANTYLSSQIKVHQATGVIDVHYGENSGSDVIFNDQTGPFCGITYMPSDFSSCYEKLWVEHNSFDVVLDSTANFDFDALHNVPPANTLYRFTPRFAVTGIDDVSAQGPAFRAWPIEHGDQLRVELPAGPGTLELHDATGRSIGQWQAVGPNMNLALPSLGRGVFVLTYQGNGIRSAVRFVR
jgi:hypothetical protein